MTISGFVEYVKQIWKNKPDRTTPITAATLTHMEDGIKGNSDAINEIAQAVADNIVNDPQKIASMASLYAVNESVKKNASDIKDVNNNLSNKADKTSLSSYAQKSDLDIKLNNTSFFVGNGENFGQAIKKTGIVQLNRVGFFICNNPSNSPLGNGLIILAHNVGYWNNHPMYIQINGSSISCGTLNCSDYTHITKD